MVKISRDSNVYVIHCHSLYRQGDSDIVVCCMPLQVSDMSVSPNGDLVSVGWDDSIAFTSFPGSLGEFFLFFQRN